MITYKIMSNYKQPLAYIPTEATPTRTVRKVSYRPTAIKYYYQSVLTVIKVETLSIECTEYGFAIKTMPSILLVLRTLFLASTYN